MHCAFDEMMPIESVIPNPRNPNTHPDKQIKLLAKIINTQGWRAPITVSKRSGFIVRGHGRLLAAQLLNLETVPVDLQDYESEAAEWADLIADNRLAELATIDDSLLAELLKEADDMVELTGYTANEIDRILGEAESSVVQDDNFDVEGAVDSATKNTITQPGDLWILGNHRLLCGDSTSVEDVLRLLGGTKRTWYLRTRHIMLPMRAAPA
ncbi:ParB/Srx family N-terminal domain-containing protein [Veillonella sp.]|uniref:ParB/Srx family N-terminal domain-containing protein n=1 Tax=Veillonella sp. TaxID=1926307 RepID=UPI0025EDA0C4|nr:ParB/Srx family N-terminal domain-containing protein [Veillonella sp.]